MPAPCLPYISSSACHLTPPPLPHQQLYIEKLHVPALRQRWSKLLVLLAFTTSAFLSLAALPRVQVGLDQAVALPRDSYLQAYYSQLLSSLRVGPPLFFVVEDLQLSSDVNKVCSVSGCSPDSMLSQVGGRGRWLKYL
jgi:Niemann-Pick C1 protein